MNGEEFIKRLEEIAKDNNFVIEAEEMPLMYESPIALLHNLIFEAGVFEAVKRMLRSEHYVTIDDIRVILNIEQPKKDSEKCWIKPDEKHSIKAAEENATEVVNE